MGRIRSILVHLDGTVRSPARLALARQVADCLEARLTALFATALPPIDIPFPYAAASAIASSGVLQDIRTQRLARALEAFDAAKAASRGELAWAELHGEPLVAAVAAQALFADLLVLGQADAAQPAAAELPADFAASVLMQAGTPALVVPSAGDFRFPARRVLVAWKPSAESARAMAAALPMLAHAQQVDVVTWGSGEPKPRPAGEPLDLERYLALHGVLATFHRHRQEPHDMGQALLETIDELRADMLVMGCYGHSRAREFVLGGASRSMFRSMTVPVLMCH